MIYVIRTRNLFFIFRHSLVPGIKYPFAIEWRKNPFTLRGNKLIEIY